MISVNDIIGNIILRTGEALSNNAKFLEDIKNYPYYQNCVIDGKLSLWHYPGTPEEIAATMQKISKNNYLNALVKFPSVFNFQLIRQEKKGINTIVNYRLAIVAMTKSLWTTEQREKYVFKPLLRPVYEELINQIKKSKYLTTDYNLSHTVFEVYTTGGKQNELIDRYSEYVDAIEIHGLQVGLSRLCEKDYISLKEDNERILQRLNEIIN